MDIKTAVIMGYQAARAAGYAGQMLSLPLVERLSTGRKQELPADIDDRRQKSLSALTQLLMKDSENISAGLYPVKVLAPEPPGPHLSRYLRILWDGYKISNRRASKNSQDFDQEAESYMDDVPEYYRRNFHFQTGGYLTEHSAKLYEHQVEILFSGGADAMRRLLIPLFKKKYEGDGEGLHFLEVGAGTGRLTRFMKLAYPKARITVTDLSWPYLQEAQRNLANFDRIEFMQTAAESLPFIDESYDAVYSCFMFHELPEKIREQVIGESRRVLKTGGLFGMVDSVQKADAEDLAWALEDFPKHFHEPFYKNYTLKPLEKLLERESFLEMEKDIGFLAKALTATKAFRKEVSKT